MKLFDDGPMYSGLYDRIYNVIIPTLVWEGQTPEHVLSRVAYELGTDYETFVKTFFNHPEWPSPKNILDYYETQKKNEEN